MARLPAKQQTGVVPPTWPLYTLPHMARLWPVYLKRRGPFLARLGFSNFPPPHPTPILPFLLFLPLLYHLPIASSLSSSCPSFLLYPRFPSSSSSSSYSNTSSSPSSTFLLFFLVFPFLLLHRFLLFL